MLPAEEYKALRALNAKGTATLAQWAGDGRKYVLKVLPKESVSVYRRICGLSPHERLMQVREIFAQGEQSVAVCGFAEGAPLSELLDEGRVFRADEVRSVISQLCCAAQHLHSCGIIHRDITPKNIILDDSLRLTLVDYDISRIFSGKREQDTTLYGTEGFAPPEQYGFRETRPTADIYSIGMVMKLLLNSCPDCPPAQEVVLRGIAAKCTRFVPNRRYRSAAAVRGAVGRSRWTVPAGAAAGCAVFLAGMAAAVLLLHNAGVSVPPISLSSAPAAEAAAPVTTPRPADESNGARAAEAAAPVTTPRPADKPSEPPAQTTSVPADAASISAPQSVSPAQTSTAPPQTTKAAPQTTAPPASAPQAEKDVSEPPEPPAQPAQTTQTAAETAPPAEPKPLHTSDMDNPNMISVTTKLNEQGFYEDFLEYEFYDDPAVHGRWDYCTCIEIQLLTPSLSSEIIRNNNYSGSMIFSSITLSEGGQAQCFLTSGEESPCDICWTNGYLICDYVEGRAAQRMFTAVLDGEEFLFAAIKTGDFICRNEVGYYHVYTRAE